MRLGLFGGTFDPVHNAHLFVAEGAREELELDRMIFVPAKGGHYRDEAPTASVADRVAMLNVAIASNPRFGLDDADLAADASGYTADLIPVLRSRHPSNEFTFVVGADSLLEAPWGRFDEVLDALDGFAIAPRADRPLDPLRDLIARLSEPRRRKVRILGLPLLAESATLVRERLAAGETIRYIVPEPVWDYIVEHRLYRQGSRAQGPQRPG